MTPGMQYTADNLLVRPVADPADPDLIISVTPERAGWEFISFQARRLAAGRSWSTSTGESELVIVPLSGRYAIRSPRGQWNDVGGRASVFAGAAHVLYLSRRTELTVTALEAGEYALAWVPTTEEHPPWHIRPEEVKISTRGGDNATRQINDLLPPGSPVHRIVLVEVYTPSGNWSSYPPHKHDVHREDEKGNILEADLEELYFYKIDRPEGYAYQRIYSGPDSPLARVGRPIDALVRPENNCAVLVPEGYHPVVSPPGYTTYYLNVLAGSAQSLAFQDDPRYSWVKDAYRDIDHRVPLY